MPLPGRQHRRQLHPGHGEAEADEPPPAGRRLSLPTVGMVVPYGAFFIPGGSGNAGGGTYAKDKLGNDVKVDEWLKTHGPNDRTRAFKAVTVFDAKCVSTNMLMTLPCLAVPIGCSHVHVYLVVEQDRTPATYGSNAVCNHLGCVVPWNAAENKFLCLCHESRYNNLSLAARTYGGSHNKLLPHAAAASDAHFCLEPLYALFCVTSSLASEITTLDV